MIKIHVSMLCVVFSQVCDEPHPLLIKDMIEHCVQGIVDEAYKVMNHLWTLGYSPEDIITIVFRVAKNHQMSEYLKLEFIKVQDIILNCTSKCTKNQIIL